MVYATAPPPVWAGGLLVCKATKITGTYVGKLNFFKKVDKVKIAITNCAVHRFNPSESLFPYLINEGNTIL